MARLVACSLCNLSPVRPVQVCDSSLALSETYARRTISPACLRLRGHPSKSIPLPARLGTRRPACRGADDQGRWAGRQIFSRDWALKSGSALRNLSKIQQYGWLWNSVEYPYKGRTVRAYFAAGNGGQIFMGIPALDLVIGFTGGNYNDPSLFIPQRRFVPDFILPAVH